MVRSRQYKWARRLVTVAAVVAVASGLAVWRLGSGPLVLWQVHRWVAAYAERRTGLTFEIDRMLLTRRGRGHGIVLGAEGVRVRNAAGATMVIVPALELHVALRPLLRGHVALRRIELVGAHVRLVRGPQGIGFAIGQDDPVEPGRAATALRALSDESLTQLPVVGVRDGTLVMTDYWSRRTWSASHVMAALWPQGTGITAQADGAIPVGDQQVLFQAHAWLGGGVAQPTIDFAFAVPRVALLGRDDGPLADGAPAVAAGLRRLTAPASLAIAARLDDRLQLADATVFVTLAHPVVHGRIDARPEGEGVHLRAEVDGEALRIPHAFELWPDDAATDVRVWMQRHLAGGHLHRVHVGAVATHDATAGLQMVSLDAGARFEDVVARDLDVLPAINDAAGRVTCGGGRCDIEVARGATAGVHIVDGWVGLTHLGRPEARVDVAVTVEGTMAKTLAILDHDPFDLVRPLGFRPATVAGNVRADVALATPLGKRPTLANIGLQVRADARNVATPRGPLDLPIDGTRATVTLVDQRLRLQADGRVVASPLAVDWQESLASGAAERRRVDLKGAIDGPARRGLGFDTAPWLEGPVDGTARWVERGNGDGSLDVDVDLARATFASPVVDVTKAAGVPGALRLRATLRQARPHDIERLELRAGDSMIAGRARLVPGAWKIETGEARAEIAPRERNEDPGHAKITIQRAADGWPVRVTSDDAGALVRALGSYAHGSGGSFVFDGHAFTTAQGLGVGGTADVRNLTIHQWPILGRVATLASLSGINSALSGAGVRFDRVSARGRYEPTTVTLDEVLATSPALGMRMRGAIRRSGTDVSLEGSVIPSYFGLNAAARWVPVIGKVFTGLKNEGVQVVDFTVTGSLAEPTVSVQPLQSIAPGLLRDLVRLLPGGSSR